MLIDEVDSFFDVHPEMRGILNSGHAREFAHTSRCVGDEHEPREFSTWCPKVLSLIGALPDTLTDRSLIIHMRRKTPTERVERLKPPARRRLRLDVTDPLIRQALRWVQDHGDELYDADVELPEALDDRAQDNWEPLIAIADVVGGDWPEQARAAALALSGAAARGPDTSLGVLLLSTIRDLLMIESPRIATHGTIFTSALLTWLSPIEAFKTRTGKFLDSIRLADLLRPFEIEPGTIRQGEKTGKGYHLPTFEEAFTRYLPPPDPAETDQGGSIPGSNPSHPTHPTRHGLVTGSTDPSQGGSVTGPQTPSHPNRHGLVSGVTGSSLETPPQRPSRKQPVLSTKQPVTEIEDDQNDVNDWTSPRVSNRRQPVTVDDLRDAEEEE